MRKEKENFAGMENQSNHPILVVLFKSGPFTFRNFQEGKKTAFFFGLILHLTLELTFVLNLVPKLFFSPILYTNLK